MDVVAKGKGFLYFYPGLYFYRRDGELCNYCIRIVIRFYKNDCYISIPGMVFLCSRRCLTMWLTTRSKYLSILTVVVCYSGWRTLSHHMNEYKMGHIINIRSMGFIEATEKTD